MYDVVMQKLSATGRVVKGNMLRCAPARIISARTAAAGNDGRSESRKNHYLLQFKIDLAKQILGARTETEALNGALDLLICGEALASGTEAMVGEEYYDLLEIAGEVPARGGGG